jgi:23S rRNA pseudouridine2605 synthase
VNEVRRVRLQKYLAEAGLGSRRRCEELISAGRVTVDGAVARLGDSVNTDQQTVEVDGHPVQAEEKEYWLLNKPRGVLSAASDARGRPTVIDIVPTRGRVFPVGRLDLNSTGLLLLTNDGELTSRLLHPRYHVEKEYVVRVRGRVSETALKRLRTGIDLEDGPTAPAQIEVAERTPTTVPNPTTTVRVIIHEGRKRQVRRMFEAVDHRVLSLHRSRFDGLTDAGLELGQARPLSTEEVARLSHAPLSEEQSTGT